jgi:hypothetical protein
VITFFIYTERSRPPFYLVTTFVWGDGHDFDSDGNSRTPHDTEWTELYCTNRSSPFERFNVEVLKEPRPRIEITSADDSAASKIALFLLMELGEQVVEVMGDGQKVPVEQQVLLSRCGDDFDLDMRSREVRDVQKSRLALLHDQTHE